MTVTKTEERHNWSGSRVGVMECPSGRHNGGFSYNGYTIGLDHPSIHPSTVGSCSYHSRLVVVKEG